MRPAPLLAVVVVLLGCGLSRSAQLDREQRHRAARARCVAGEAPPYFPEVDEQRRCWFGEHLEAMKEPVLTAKVGEEREVYRLLWLRAFHHPIAVRIERHGDSVRLFAKRLDGAGGYAPGELEVDRVREVSLREFKRLRADLDRIDLWRDPPLQATPGLDGAEWILEAVRPGRRALVMLWTGDVLPEAVGGKSEELPPKNRAFAAAALRMLDLAHLKPWPSDPALY